MLETTVYDRYYHEKTPPLSINITNDKVKNSCIECIIHAIEQGSSYSLKFPWDLGPYSYVMSECVKVTGIKQNRDIGDDKKRFINLLNSVNGPDFFVMIEQSYHYIINNYNNSVEQSLSNDLNTIFKRNNIGIRIVDRTFIIILEETEYTEYIKPCLVLLDQTGFVDADKHLIEAFTRFHNGDYEKSVLESSLAFESTIDQIMDELGISKPEKNNDFHQKIRKIRDTGIAFYFDDNVGLFLDSVFSPIRSRNIMPGVAHNINKPRINEAENAYVLENTISSILYIVRSYVRDKDSIIKHNSNK